MLKPPDMPALAELTATREFQFWATVVAFLWVVLVIVWLYALAVQVLADRAMATRRIPRGLPLTVPPLGSTIYYRLVESAYIDWEKIPETKSRYGYSYWGRDLSGRTWLVEFSRRRDGYQVSLYGKVPALTPQAWELQPTRRRAQDAVVALLMQE